MYRFSGWKNGMQALRSIVKIHAHYLLNIGIKIYFEKILCVIGEGAETPFHHLLHEYFHYYVKPKSMQVAKNFHAYACLLHKILKFVIWEVGETYIIWISITNYILFNMFYY